VTTSLVIKYK